MVEHLTHEAYRARTHWDAWGAMEEAFPEYALELNQTPAFWVLTRRAHQDAVVLRLGRLYDPHAAATSLGNFLATLQEKAPLAGTILPAKAAKLSMTKLGKDIKSVSSKNHAVVKLLTVRNEYLAHRGPQHVTKGTFSALPKLEKKDLSHLLANAVRIMTTYRRAFSYPPLIWGEHEVREFERLLALVRAGHKAQHDD